MGPAFGTFLTDVAVMGACAGWGPGAWRPSPSPGASGGGCTAPGRLLAATALVLAAGATWALVGIHGRATTRALSSRAGGPITSSPRGRRLRPAAPGGPGLCPRP